MIYVNNGNEVGLGKSKFLRKITLKGALRAGKFLAPIAAGFIPVVGGTSSGILSRLLKNKDGSASFAGRVTDQVSTFSKSNVGIAVKSLAKQKVLNPQVENQTKAQLPAAQKRAVQNNQPVGELTAVTPAMATEPLQTLKKDNTVLYVAGAAALLGVGYLATRKK